MTPDEPSPSGGSGAESGRPIKEHLRSRSTWTRLFFMLVVCLLYAVARVVIIAVVALQFFWVLLTGATNGKLERLGQALATYTYQVIRYLTYNTEERPFPFDADWPKEPPAP